MTNLLYELRNGHCVGLSFGGPSLVTRLAVMCNPPEFGGVIDPDPGRTIRHGTQLVAVHPVADTEDGDEGELTVTPADHADAIVEYLQYVRVGARQHRHHDFVPYALTGWGHGCTTAVELLRRHRPLFGRVALILPSHARSIAEGSIGFLGARHRA